MSPLLVFMSVSSFSVYGSCLLSGSHFTLTWTISSLLTDLSHSSLPVTHSILHIVTPWSSLNYKSNPAILLPRCLQHKWLSLLYFMQDKTLHTHTSEIFISKPLAQCLAHSGLSVDKCVWNKINQGVSECHLSPNDDLFSKKYSNFIWFWQLLKNV